MKLYWLHPAGLPVPSRELSHVVWAKARASWLLEWRAPREAGFTEQRKLLAPDSGRITGHCSTSPPCQAKRLKNRGGLVELEDVAALADAELNYGNRVSIAGVITWKPFAVKPN
ncbi:hypothetical protein L6164_029219 [Bauhinia variegata]|uniref:Uncharacterized protein n=1 Tax=Bauhinia variegata TaxID=167791 RepID=A0ACB9L9C6_BAUVA|nr:hypothetical protein L6164_029219 [Bauhinia variegata]